jgi:hypothetical protein
MSAERNDGGPAFPLTTPAAEWDADNGGWRVTGSAISGMTLRDYFAAHAPEVPEWFKFATPPLPTPLHYSVALTMVPGYRDLYDRDRNTLRTWMSDGSYDIEPPLQAIGDAAHRLIAERNLQMQEAMRANAAGRFFAWRWYYADQMLAGRSA